MSRLIITLILSITNVLLVFGGIGGSVWMIYCINRTHEDRIRLINTWSFRPMSWQALSKAYQAVPFKEHLRARVLLRDPWKLYDPIVHDAVTNPRTEVMSVMQMADQEVPEKPPTIQ